MRALYTAEALATGEGRDGHGRTSDGRVDVDLATPTDMGGSGNGTNPEQLFAVGYADCFHEALRLVAGQTQANSEDSSVGYRVSIGKDQVRGLQLVFRREVNLPLLVKAEAKA